MNDEQRKARDQRALAVAGLLRSGWSAREISAGLKVIDAGGGVLLAIDAMYAERRSRQQHTSDAT
jgi:hypothetical protein